MSANHPILASRLTTQLRTFAGIVTLLQALQHQCRSKKRRENLIGLAHVHAVDQQVRASDP